MILTLTLFSKRKKSLHNSFMIIIIVKINAPREEEAARAEPVGCVAMFYKVLNFWKNEI